MAAEGVIQVTVHVADAPAGSPAVPAAPAAPSLTAADPAPTGTPVVATRPAPSSSSPLPRTGASVEGLLLVACALLLLGAALVTVVRLRQEQHHA